LVNPLNTMAHILLAIFLVLFGLNILIDINLPSWILGTLALVAGILMLAERFGITAKRK
jgi:MFS superfamily sulfate permease-like transporter